MLALMEVQNSLHRQERSTDQKPGQTEGDGCIAHGGCNQPDCAYLVKLVKVFIEFHEVDGDCRSKSATYKCVREGVLCAAKAIVQRDMKAVMTINDVTQRFLVSA